MVQQDIPRIFGAVITASGPESQVVCQLRSVGLHSGAPRETFASLRMILGKLDLMLDYRLRLLIDQHAQVQKISGGPRQCVR